MREAEDDAELCLACTLRSSASHLSSFIRPSHPGTSHGGLSSLFDGYDL